MLTKISNAILLCTLYACFAAAQFVAGGDSVRITPAKPTPKDSITYNFYDSDACCCAQVVTPSVSVVDTMVRLSFSVNTTPCQICDCISAGKWYAFKGGPLKAGKYGIYRVQSFYCPPGSLCPEIVILPVRIGEVVVANSTSIASVRSAPVDNMIIRADARAIHVNFSRKPAGVVRVNVYNAQGMLINRQEAGVQGFSWTAMAKGVYLLTVDLNGVIVSSQKVIVSR